MVSGSRGEGSTTGERGPLGSGSAVGVGATTSRLLRRLLVGQGPLHGARAERGNGLGSWAKAQVEAVGYRGWLCAQGRAGLS